MRAGFGNDDRFIERSKCNATPVQAWHRPASDAVEVSNTIAPREFGRAGDRDREGGQPLLPRESGPVRRSAEAVPTKRCRTEEKSRYRAVLVAGSYCPRPVMPNGLGVSRASCKCRWTWLSCVRRSVGCTQPARRAVPPYQRTARVLTTRVGRHGSLFIQLKAEDGLDQSSRPVRDAPPPEYPD
jgi:hypothetical protein